MPLLPSLLILASCFLHATWNLMARRSRCEVVFFQRMLMAAVPMSLAAMAGAACFAPGFPLRAFWLVLGSGSICGGYFLFLALAYESSDFTIVYPVARALPVLIVGVGDLLLRHRAPSPVGWLAMLLVTVGCVLAPQRSLRGFDAAHYRSKTFVWIALTAGTIAAFTMLDKLAAETVAPGLPSAIIQTALFHVFAAAAYLALRPVVAGSSRDAGRVGWRWPAAAAAVGLVTYTLVLWAFQMSDKTGYLLAFRQFSIVVGVVAAFVIYKERGLMVRLPASLCIVAGLVLLKLFG